MRCLSYISGCLLTAVLLLLQPASSSAQPRIQTIEKDNLTLHYRLWSKEDGMPHWHVGGFFQDSRGFIWMQNQAFLTRFDGKSFSVYDTLDISPVTLPKAFFGEDVRGNIWYFLSTDSLPTISILNPFTREIQSLESYTGLKSPAHDIQYLYSIDKIVYAVSTKSHKVWKYDGRLSLVFENEHPQFIERCGFYLPGPDNTFWFGDGLNKFSLLDKKGQILKQFPIISNKESIISYFKKQIYTYSVNPKDPDFLKSQSLTDELQKGFIPNGADVPWFFPGWGNAEYLADLKAMLYYNEQLGNPIIFDLRNKQRINLLAEASKALGHPQVTNFIYPPFRCDFIAVNPRLQSNGVLLIPINGKGLLHVEIKPKRFQTLAVNTSIRTLTFLNPETLLAVAAMETPSLFEINTASGITKNLPWGYGPYSGTVQGQYLWMSNRNMNLERRNLRYQLIDNYPRPTLHQITPNLEIRSITTASDSTIWYATQMGVVSLNLNTRKSQFIFSDREACWIHKDQKGTFWAATAQGLYHFDSGKTFLSQIRGKNLRVEHIYESPEGYFWLATFHGLVKWKPFSDSTAIYDTSAGFMSDQLHAVYPDRRGRLWMSSNNGIMAFDPSEHRVVNFTTADGLADNEHNYLAHARSQNGQLYFGGVRGVSAFQPDDFPGFDDFPLNRLSIDKIQQLNRDGQYLPPLYPGLSLDSIIKLDRSCIQTVFKLSLPDFSNNRLSFQWRMEGLFPQWSHFDLEDGIIISGIPHGASQLEIRVSPSANLRQADIYRFSLYKAYYFYQQSWFRILSLFSLVFTLYLFLKRRTAALEANNRALEEKVSERTATILAQKKQLELIDQAKTQLFNNISHEFRTPLSLIQGNTEKLKMDLAGQKGCEKALQQIEKQTEILTNMIDDVMDLSKLQMGAMASQTEQVAWNAFIRRTFAMFDGLAKRKQQGFHLETNPSIETYCPIDLKKTERILSNLISNAIKFTPEAGRVTVRSEVRSNNILVEVSDTGPGISPDEKEFIFERYRQGQAALGAAQPGYGIGLALCKEYANLIGADLWVESDPGKGASFFLRIPVTSENLIHGQQHTNIDSSGNTHQPTPSGSAAMGHILIAEDHPDLLDFMVEMLREDYRISTAANGQEAWYMLEKDPSISLVISDVMMPAVNGFELLQKTRAHAQLGFLPFIMVTALNSDQDKLRALRLGVDGFITKPFAIAELKTQIANRMKQQLARKDFTETENPQKASNHTPESYDEVWISDLEAKVRDNLHRPEFKIPELALLMLHTERTLYNRVKAYTGLTPSEYLRKARLDLAMRYVMARRFKTLKELAYAVGMSDPRNFANAFKKEFGRAPMEVTEEGYQQGKD